MASSGERGGILDVATILDFGLAREIDRPATAKELESSLAQLEIDEWGPANADAWWKQRSAEL